MKSELPTPTASPDLAAAITTHLVSPRSHRPLEVVDGTIRCDDSGFHGSVRDGVAVMSESTQWSFFDDKFAVMQAGHARPGEWALCYAQQTALLQSYLRPGQVVLDVGCGPSLPYRPPPGVYTIGLEPSFHSIRVNHAVDLRVCGSATAIPLASASIDLVVCFYSIHHMVGRTRAETRGNVAAAFAEFGRVLKPGGQLFVFEMTPASVFDLAQRVVWNRARRALPSKLDMYFWSAAGMADLGHQHLPADAILEKIFFGASSMTMIPPVFSLPWLRIPRFFYPLDAKLYKWRIPGA